MSVKRTERLGIDVGGTYADLVCWILARRNWTP